MTELDTTASTPRLTRAAILARLQDLLREVLDLETAEAIRPESRLQEDLHVDSLGMLDVVIGVEERFGLKVGSDVNLFETVHTVDDAVSLIERLDGARG